MKYLILFVSISLALPSCQSNSGSWRDSAPTELDIDLLTRAGGWVVDTAATNKANTTFIKEVSIDMDNLTEKYKEKPFINKGCNLDYWQQRYRLSLTDAGKIIAEILNNKGDFVKINDNELVWSIARGSTHKLQRVPVGKYLVFQKVEGKRRTAFGTFPPIRFMIQSLDDDSLEITFVQFLDAWEGFSSCHRILPEENVMRLMPIILIPTN